VARIDQDSTQLAEALAGEQSRIIITTLQKFPFILDKVADLGQRRFAVIGGRLRPNRSLSGRHRDLVGEDGPNPAGHEVGRRVPLEGLREEVTLAELATQLPQPRELGRRLDALRHGRQAEGLPDLDDFPRIYRADAARSSCDREPRGRPLDPTDEERSA
jgi:hypothetical protein